MFITLGCPKGRNEKEQLSLYPVHLQQDAGLASGVAKRRVLDAGAVLQQRALELARLLLLTVTPPLDEVLAWDTLNILLLLNFVIISW